MCALGRLGGWMFIAVGVLVTATFPYLSSPGPPNVRYAFQGLGAVVVGIVALQIPWARAHRVALMGLPLIAIGVMGLPTADPGAQHRMLPVLIMVFVFTGLTQKRGWVVAMVPLSVGTWWTGRGDWSVPPALVLDVGVGFAIAIVLSTVLAQHRSELASRKVMFAGTRRLGHTRSVDEAMILLEDSVAEHLNARIAVVLISDDHGPTGWRVGVSDRHRLEDEALAYAVGAMVRSDDDGRASGVARWAGGLTVVALPLKVDTALAGLVVVAWSEGDARPAGIHDVGLEVFLTQAAHQIIRLRQTARVGGEVASDPLTGLANRRTVEARLSRIEPGDAVVVLALDHENSETLRSFAGYLADSCRRADWCGRLDREKFVVVLGQAGADAAPTVHGLRRRWRATAHAQTFSAGLAVHEAGRSAFETLARADAGLSSARAGGQDRIERLEAGDAIAAVETIRAAHVGEVMQAVAPPATDTTEDTGQSGASISSGMSS